MKARFLTTLILVCSVALLSGCGKKGDEAANEAEEKPPTLVEVTTAELGELSQTVEFTGSVESTMDSAVAAKVGGRIAAIAADEGDFVAAGSVLVTIDPTDYADQATQAESGLQIAQAQLEYAKTEKAVGDVSIDAQAAQAQAALRAAVAGLTMARDGARPQERAQAEAAFEAAKSSLATAEADFARMERLYEEGAVSLQVYDKAKLGYDVAKSQHEQAAQALSLIREGARPEEIDQAEAQVEQARYALNSALAAQERKVALASAVESAEAGAHSAEAAYSLAANQLAETSVRAPFSGHVAARYVDVGEMVAPGTPVASLVSLESLFVRAGVSEREIDRIRVGMPAAVTLDAIPGEVLDGKISEILPSARPDSRNFAAKIEVRDPERRLKPGMFARARVTFETLKGAITIPKRAVFERGGKAYVFVIKGRVAVLKEVGTGLREGERVQITEGVEPGDRVVTIGHGRLKDADKVRIHE